MDKILSHLPKIVSLKKKRVGRGLGSGKGAKSGRGTTRHQKARERIPLDFEGGQGRIIKKFPLLRGKGKNKPVSKKPVIVSLDRLNLLKDGDVVDIQLLIRKRIISQKVAKLGVKILDKGEIKRRLTVKIPVSKKVKEKIEAQGGKVEI